MRSTSTAFDSSGKGRRMAGSPLNPQRRSRSTGYRWERDRRGIVAGTLNQTRSHCRQSGSGSAGEDSEGRSCGGRLTGIWRGFPPGGPGSFLAGGGQGGCRRRRGGGVEMVGTVATGRGGRPLHANAANGTDLDAADQHHSDLAVLTTTRSPQISGLMGVLWAHVFVLDPHLNREAAVHGQHLQAREEYSKDPPRLLTREHACRCSDWPLRLRRPVCRHARPSSEQARMRGRKTPWDHLTAIVGVSVGAVVCRRGT